MRLANLCDIDSRGLQQAPRIGRRSGIPVAGPLVLLDQVRDHLVLPCRAGSVHSAADDVDRVLAMTSCDRSTAGDCSGAMRAGASKQVPVRPKQPARPGRTWNASSAPLDRRSFTTATPPRRISSLKPSGLGKFDQDSHKGPYGPPGAQAGVRLTTFEPEVASEALAPSRGDPSGTTGHLTKNRHSIHGGRRGRM